MNDFNLSFLIICFSFCDHGNEIYKLYVRVYYSPKSVCIHIRRNSI